MRRIMLTVAFDGTNYSGWQIQPNKETIEAFQEVEEMKKHPENVKSYSSFSDLLNEVKQDV